MEDLGENTTVLSSLRSLNNFISQRVDGGAGLDAAASAPGSLQMQYQQSMQLEERAEQIRSKSHIIQVEREKMQMQLSHKRARVELERAASTSARSYEREVDRNQELLTRIRQLQDREAEAEEKMKEQLEHHRQCKQSLDAANKRLREKEDGLAEAGETISELKGRISELQWSVMNQEMQVKGLESEKQELQEQLDLQLRKWQEANQKIQELQAGQEARAEQEQKIKDLEQKLFLQEQDSAIVKNMKSELVRLPKMERELKQLKEENAYLREMRETNGLLREEVEGLQRKLSRQEKMQENLVDLELEKERLLAKLQSWERLDQTTGLSIRSPEDLSRFIVELQQRELALKDRNGSITSSVRELDKVRQQLQEEVRQVSAQLLEERKKRETHEALARRLQKRVLLLTKERDGMRAILGSYDSELTPAEYSPQLTRRMREAEDMVQKVHAHSSEMEAQLSQALEELGSQKQRADMLEMELKVLQAQAGPAEQSVLLSREEASELRMKVEELEGERSRLEEDKRRLEEQLEHLTLQGDYDQSKTKVLHLSANPAREAQQSRRQDQARLHRGPTRDLDPACCSFGRSSQTPLVPPSLSLSLTMTCRGQADSTLRDQTRQPRRGTAVQPGELPSLSRGVLGLSPQGGQDSNRADHSEPGSPGGSRPSPGRGLASTMARCSVGQPRLLAGTEQGLLREGPMWIRELRKQVESAELRNQRLKEVFQAKVQEFRKVCYTLTGYQVDITRESQYRLTSMYAERQDDCLVFKATGPPAFPLSLPGSPPSPEGGIPGRSGGVRRGSARVSLRLGHRAVSAVC
ncbi:PREDICTED: mitotic spindle assembly checkpoint protein MAD1 [Myotis brandtii]|nr:PREDICTED: mitotic spindle assembly checkpoint protein MAD1 [Myotis brandtii]